MLTGGMKGNLVVSVCGVETGVESALAVYFGDRVTWSTRRIRILPVLAFLITTRGAAHSDASVTGTITPCDTNWSSLDFTSGRSQNGIGRAPFT
ncbi:hypothetical protein OUZ56_010612 [Daphnia magna]|uniref:Secreted protein n=1 Tax=Daphnia magna TaxID=35525 RepID=A0ABR0AJ18_9CRUS|nr:hypothetical protein OUZ56_010612 [Daphnia magna]